MLFKGLIFYWLQLLFKVVDVAERLKRPLLQFKSLVFETRLQEVRFTDLVWLVKLYLELDLNFLVYAFLNAF